MSHGKVAKKRYKTVDHRGDQVTFGEGWITGHQKRRPVPKNDAYSNRCQASECMANSNAAGMCHPMSASTATNQQKIGFRNRRPSCWTKIRFEDPDRNTADALRTNRGGRACANDRNGAPSRIKGGATAINKT